METKRHDRPTGHPWARLKEFYWVYYPAFNVDASERQENGTVLNRRRQFGPMLLSRWPIIWSRSILLPKLNTLHSMNMDSGAIECVVDVPSGPLRIYTTHLSAVKSARERLMQIDRLLEIHPTKMIAVLLGPEMGGMPIPSKPKIIFKWTGATENRCRQCPPIPCSWATSTAYRRVLNTSALSAKPTPPPAVAPISTVLWTAGWWLKKNWAKPPLGGLIPRIAHLVFVNGWTTVS
jgi:hypothetical protein